MAGSAVAIRKMRNGTDVRGAIWFVLACPLTQRMELQEGGLISPCESASIDSAKSCDRWLRRQRVSSLPNVSSTARRPIPSRGGGGGPGSKSKGHACLRALARRHNVSHTAAASRSRGGQSTHAAPPALSGGVRSEPVRREARGHLLPLSRCVGFANASNERLDRTDGTKPCPESILPTELCPVSLLSTSVGKLPGRNAWHVSGTRAARI